MSTDLGELNFLCTAQPTVEPCNIQLR